MQLAHKQKGRPLPDGLFGANEQIRTADLIITNDVRYLLRHVSISIFIAAPRWHIAFRKRKSFSLPIYYNVKTLSCQLFFCNSQKQFFIAVLRYTRGQKCKLRVLSRTGEYVRFAYARYPLFIQFTHDLNCINTLIIIN